MHRPELNATCEQQDSETLIRKFLVVAGELFCREITPLMVTSWIGALRDIDPEKLGPLLKQCLRENVRPFPFPGDILAMIRSAENVVEFCEAERAWDQALRHANQNGGYCFPVSAVPAIQDVAIEAGIRACGGIDRLASCSEDELKWARKTFLEVYGKFTQEPAAHGLVDEIPEDVKRLAAGKQLAQ